MFTAWWFWLTMKAGMSRFPTNWRKMRLGNWAMLKHLKHLMYINKLFLIYWVWLFRRFSTASSVPSDIPRILWGNCDFQRLFFLQIAFSGPNTKLTNWDHMKNTTFWLRKSKFLKIMSAAWEFFRWFEFIAGIFRVKNTWILWIMEQINNS